MKATKIIVHHSLTSDSSTVSWGAIRKYHVETLGWRDVGYHVGVELTKSGDNLYYETFLGRDWDDTGAHTKGQNESSLGICFVGNWDIQEPPGDMLIVGARVIRMWLRLFGIKPSEVYGHRDFANKSCPGLLFSMNKLRFLIGE